MVTKNYSMRFVFYNLLFMKKNILISAFLCLSFSFVFGQIAFENNHTLDMLKAKAKKEKKLIFIDAYTTWCGPCKWISAIFLQIKMLPHSIIKTLSMQNLIWKIKAREQK
jgi:thiol-disulfide isomerase/thioredoxin